MINIERTETAPDCLKNKIDYKCDDVLDKLENDFFGKCYICETNLFSTNVEHFIAHKGNKKLKFDWRNLFLACFHCNNIKLTTDILDCTEPNSDIEEKIIYKSISDVNESIQIEANDSYSNDNLTKNTVTVLNKVYNGHTKIKTKDANKLKEYFLGEMLQFRDLILKYNKERHNKLKTSENEKNIEAELHKGSKLTAFKRQIIKDFKNYHKLKQYFD